MRDLLSIGTSRGCEMIGTGIGFGLSTYSMRVPQINPSALSGLQLWVDSNDSSTVLQSSGGAAAVADGDPVGYWGDKSGNSRHLVQSSGTNKPTIRTGVKAGNPVVRFDGVNDWMSVSSSTDIFKFLHGSYSSLFMVVKFASVTGYKPVFGTGSSSANTGYLCFFDSGNFYLPWVSKGSLGNLVCESFKSSFLSSSVWYSVSALADVQNPIAANRSTTFRNAGNLFATNTKSNSLSALASSFDLQFGREPNSSTYSGFDVAEILIYDQLLTNQQRLGIESYLNAKWSIY